MLKVVKILGIQMTAAIGHKAIMSNSVKEPEVQSHNKIVKAKETVSLVATAIPVVGFVGTIALWAASNFYVGDVVITTDKPYTSLTVKAFDKKGQESTFHTPRFQLTPGFYHLEITADNGGARHADATVAFHRNAAVAVSIAQPEQQVEEQSEDSSKKRHWWQVWRRSEN